MSSSLALVPGTRVGGAVSAGGQKADRHFLEFVVDGRRLGQVLGPVLGYDDATEDYVPVLVLDWPTDIALEDLDRLLGAAALPQLDGRTAMYICAECGDLGCGAVTAVVEVDDVKVVWRDFGYQNDYEPFDQDSAFAGVGPFTFERHAYSVVLEQFRFAVSATRPPPGDTGEDESSSFDFSGGCWCQVPLTAGWTRPDS